LARYEQSVCEIVELVGIPGRSDPKADLLILFRNWLREKPVKKWLIVLDNADEVDFLVDRDGGSPSLYEHLPNCEHGAVLITSRSMPAMMRLVDKRATVIVPPMTVQQAIELLNRKLGPDEDIPALAAALHYVPLAITQAASSIRSLGTRSSIQTYLKELSMANESNKSLQSRKAAATLQGDSDHPQQQRNHEPVDLYQIEDEPLLKDNHETTASRQVVRPSWIDSSALSSDSEVSDAESMSSLFSSRSLASSVSSLASAGWTEETIRGFVDQIFCTTQLTEVHRAALEDEAIGTERYRRNIRRMIANFGIAVKPEAAVSNQLFAAKAISSRRMSERVARMIVEHNDRHPQIEARLLTQRNIARQDPILEMSTREVDYKYLDDSASECSEASTDQEEPEDIVGEQFLAAKKFLEGSNAFLEFQQRLIEFVHQPYEKRVRRCLTLTSGKPINTGDNDGRGPIPRELVIDQHRLDALINEMAWVPTTLFEFCSSRQITLMDRLKILVEDLMRAELNWQPFPPPTRQLPIGFMCIKWQTVRQSVAAKRRGCPKPRRVCWLSRDIVGRRLYAVQRLSGLHRIS
jgi:hypothetical protein